MVRPYTKVGGPGVLLRKILKKNATCWRILVGHIINDYDIVAIITTFMQSVFINATIITEFVLESGPVLAGPTGPVAPALGM